MMCDECRRLLQKWLEAALDDDATPIALPVAVTRHAESCADCRARVEAARIVTEHRPVPVPSGDLADRVKARVRDHAQARDRNRFAPGVWRFAASAAVVAVAVFAGIVIGRSLPDTGTAPGETAIAAGQGGGADASAVVRVEFRLEAPQASEVVVVGDWNGWDAQADPLRDSNGDGIWETTVVLRPGEEYQYQFLVDDETWLPDPSSPLTVDDGFGGTNSILNI